MGRIDTGRAENTIPVIVLTAMDGMRPPSDYLQRRAARIILNGSWDLRNLGQTLQKLASAGSKAGGSRIMTFLNASAGLDGWCGFPGTVPQARGISE